MTLKEWCIENNRKDILKEFVETMNDIELDNTKECKPQNIKYDSNKYAIWECQACGRKYYLTIKQRISLPTLNCSCKQQEKSSSRTNSKNKVLRRVNNKGTAKELQDLCRILKTSKVEQYIYIYIKNLFPDSITGKNFNWLGRSEFDIYIPDLQLAIEYDGIYHHKEKINIDKEKNKLAQEHNITLFRIRENGLPLISPTDYIYTNTKSKDYSNIDVAINAIIKFINNNYNMNIEYIKNFNFITYQKQILDEMRNQKIKNSICSKWPEINEYWDYKKNGKIKPEDITISKKIKLWAECPFCHKNVEFSPHSTYRYNGKESFSPFPHRCEKRNEYCLNYLKEHYRQHHNNDIQGNSLQARRVRDWIKHIKYVFSFDKELEYKLKKELKEININI